MEIQTIKIIKERMKELGFTQMALAEKVGVSTTTLNMWFKGKRNPTLENFYLLLSTLDLNCEIRKVA